MDNITGYVLKDNILEQIVKKNGDLNLSSIKRKSIFSNYESPIPITFDKLMVFILILRYLASRRVTD